jgi:hypothetical protein
VLGTHPASSATSQAAPAFMFIILPLVKSRVGRQAHKQQGLWRLQRGEKSLQNLGNRLKSTNKMPPYVLPSQGSIEVIGVGDFVTSASFDPLLKPIEKGP